MSPLFETVTDLASADEILRRRSYGVIHARAGRVVAIHLRPFPKWTSAADIALLESLRRFQRHDDCCWLYYNQPWSCRSFLAVKYLRSRPGTRMSTIAAALRQLDRIAELKRIDALLCDVANRRISDRLLARQGWQPHAPSRFHRNYIKRFYGQYPSYAG
jgi:hypothetical protein